ncbi:MAG: hypothetical protein M1823_002837 [Watsoniomyces obsoletus]|nr:MAG: hypothetical protein M1823_002837 [Watsoniomyces obsoletus]
MCCNLYDGTENKPASTAPQTALAGTLVSSLHRLKDIDNSDGGFFVFGDLSVKIEGEFRLLFSLFEMFKYGVYSRTMSVYPYLYPTDWTGRSEVVHIKSVMSEPFTVYAPKNFPGMAESTFISRSFGDQGVRLRIRKEPRTLMKRGVPAGLSPEEYRTGYPPHMPGADPRPPMTLSPGEYGAPSGAGPSQDYSPYGGPTKRHRTSLDLTPRYSLEGDQSYEQRAYQPSQSFPPFGRPNPAYQSFSTGPSQPSVTAYHPLSTGASQPSMTAYHPFSTGASQPSVTAYHPLSTTGTSQPSVTAGPSDFTFRPPQTSTTPSPYDSPGSQRTQQSPMATSPGYQQQQQPPPPRYFGVPPYQPTRNLPATSAPMSSTLDLGSMPRTQSYQPLGPLQPITSASTVGGLSIPTTGHLPFPVVGSNRFGSVSSSGSPLPLGLSMPHPPGSVQRRSLQLDLPPLQASGTSGITRTPPLPPPPAPQETLESPMQTSPTTTTTTQLGLTTTTSLPASFTAFTTSAPPEVSLSSMAPSMDPLHATSMETLPASTYAALESIPASVPTSLDHLSPSGVQASSSLQHIASSMQGLPPEQQHMPSSMQAPLEPQPMSSSSQSSPLEQHMPSAMQTSLEQLASSHQPTLQQMPSSHQSPLEHMSSSNQPTLQQMPSSHQSPLEHMSSSNQPTLQQMTPSHQVALEQMPSSNQPTLQQISSSHQPTLEQISASIQTTLDPMPSNLAPSIDPHMESSLPPPPPPPPPPDPSPPS